MQFMRFASKKILFFFSNLRTIFDWARSFQFYQRRCSSQSRTRTRDCNLTLSIKREHALSIIKCEKNTKNLSLTIERIDLSIIFDTTTIWRRRSIISLDIASTLLRLASWFYVNRRVRWVQEWIRCVKCYDLLFEYSRLDINFNNSERWLFITSTNLSSNKSIAKRIFVLYVEDEFELLKTSYISTKTTISHERYRVQLILIMQLVASNNETLTKTHEECLNWVKKHDFKFVSKKYQLIHFAWKRDERTWARIEIERRHYQINITCSISRCSYELQN